MALPYIVFVTSEGCGHCAGIKKGGKNSPYYKAVQVARTYGNVVIINTQTLSERPELPHVPQNLYLQVKEYPSLFVFSNDAWQQLYHNANIMGYKVREWLRPGELEKAMTNVGYEPTSGGKIYGAELPAEEKDAIAMVYGVTTTPAGFKSPVSQEVTHVKYKGHTVPLTEFIAYSQ